MNKIGIVAFAFGSPSNIPQNRTIARIATSRAKQLGAPVYTQQDIVLIRTEITVDYTDEELGHPPPTLRIARGAMRWAKERGLNELLIVCAYPHIWRAKRDLQEAAQEVKEEVKIHVCKEATYYPENYWFYPSSEQWWTRSRREWDRRESILMILPYFVYKYIAK